MVLKKAIGFLILALMIGFSSCKPSYYFPTNQNVLRFKEKGDVNAAAGMDIDGFGCLNLGYAVTNNVALISDFKTFRPYSPASSMKHKTGDYLWDNELVFFKKYQDYIYPAINFGYGFGQFDRNVEYYRLGIDRQFIQPSIGFSNDFFDFAFSSRFSRVHYDLNKRKEFDLSTTQSFEQYYDFLDVGKKIFYFFEPTVTIGGGYKFVKLRYQASFVNELSSWKIRYTSFDLYATLTFTFNINKLFIKDKN